MNLFNVNQATCQLFAQFICLPDFILYLLLTELLEVLMESIFYSKSQLLPFIFF
jgi:hypothetical protein